MKPRVSMRDALSDPQLLGSVLVGDSWRLWRVLLIATCGEPLSPDELDAFRAVTGRDAPPTRMVEEALFLIGRRGGKDRAASVLATYLSALCDHADVLAPGERGVAVCLGWDQRQAKVQKSYIEGCFRTSPILSKMVAGSNADVLSLDSGIDVEVRAASFRTLRGLTAVAVVASETAFWYDAETGSSNTDAEILNAVRPSLATTGGPVILITTPYARRGETWDLYRRHFRADGDPLILVAQGASTTFNPTLPEHVVRRALERDPAAAAAEYLAQFRSDVEGFVSRDVVEACVDPGVRERAPVSRTRYVAFADPSGGSADSFTLAIAHREKDRAVLDLLRERKPPFSPEHVVQEFAEVLKRYRITRVRGDRYAGEWPAEQFRKRGIRYEAAAKPKSDIYRDALPALNSGKVSLLDEQRLIAQLTGLERRTARSGKDSIDHAPGGHDDVANAAMGAVVELGTDAAGNYARAMIAAVGPERDPYVQRMFAHYRRTGT